MSNEKELGADTHKRIEGHGIVIDIDYGSAEVIQAPPYIDDNGNMQIGGTITEWRNGRGELIKRICDPPSVKIVYRNEKPMAHWWSKLFKKGQHYE
jgi:hypothetical protein